MMPLKVLLREEQAKSQNSIKQEIIMTRAETGDRGDRAQMNNTFSFFFKTKSWFVKTK